MFLCCPCINDGHLFSGSILEGPDPSKLRPIVEQAMPTLINSLKDESVVVRDTAAWTLGRVCELSPEAAVNDTYLNALLEALVLSLKVTLSSVYQEVI